MPDFSRFLPTTFLAALLPTWAIAPHDTAAIKFQSGTVHTCEVPFEFKGEKIVVRAAIGKLQNLSFLIDTGSAYSMVDGRVVKKLDLKQEERQYRLMAFGKTTKAVQVLIRGLRMGPVLTSIRCFVVDLSAWEVDGVIGLDLLAHRDFLINVSTQEIVRNRNFTIDFGAHTLRFGWEDSLESEIPLEVDPLQICIAAKILGKPVRLAVDTGAAQTNLFRSQDWVDRLPALAIKRVFGISGAARQREVLLPELELGPSTWKNLSAIVLGALGQPSDGVLAIAQLNFKILHFDFENNRLSWKR